jgi:membrane protease subunit HflK
MAWNEGGGNKNPWDKRPQQGSSDLDEVVRSWQRKLAQLLGGGQSGRGGGGAAGRSNLNWGAIALLLIAIWAATGFYIVGAAERGVVLRFGRHVSTVVEGVHWHWPWPIERRVIVDVGRNESIDDKTRMLTSDENLVDVSIAVQFRRADPVKYLFNVRDPEPTLKDVSESAIREVVGQSELDAVLVSGRPQITERTKALIQRTLDSYDTGLTIISVNLTAVSVPDQVAPSQKDAIRAREDRDRFSLEAQAYANEIVPKARGTAARQIQDAQAYRARVIAEAEGDTARFGQLLAAYERAPAVTRERMYLETVESVLARSRKVIIDTRDSGNVLYLPLDKLLERGGVSTDSSALLAPGATRQQDAPVETVTVDQSRSRGER